MCSGSEAGSYLRLIDFVYDSTQEAYVYVECINNGASMSSHLLQVAWNPEP